MYKYKQNDTVKIKESVSNYGRYAPYKGEIGKITSHNNDFVATIRLDSGEMLYHVGLSVIEHINTNNKSETSKERLIKSLNEKRKEIESIQKKLKFLEETNQTQFNKNEFKVYNTLKTIEAEDLTLYEKTVKIAELLK